MCMFIQLVFQPVACGLDTRRLMRCVHNGWIKAKDCQKILAVKCTGKRKKIVLFVMT